jgi:putative hydrolase of the HAD superfamily
MKNIRAVIFDLDDTLYDERQFVESGFKAVAKAISLRYRTIESTEKKCYEMLCDILDKYGRGQVFDIFLRHIGKYDSQLVDELVDIYRRHQSHIALHPETFGVLSELKCQGYKLGVITDGHICVQKNKIRSLGIEKLFDCIILSDEYGVECRKPSFVPYQKAVEILKTDFIEAMYVGDNPYKDFISARKLGMYSVRILRGMYRDIRLGLSYEADMEISSLDEIFPVLDSQVK